VNQTVPTPPPTAVMMQLLGGFQVSQAVFAAANLGVATILEQEGPKTVAALAERTGAQSEPLGRLIRTLASVGGVQHRRRAGEHHPGRGDALGEASAVLAGPGPDVGTDPLPALQRA